MKVEIKTETGVRQIEVRVERCALCGSDAVYPEDGCCPVCDEWEAFGLNSWRPCPNLHIMLESVDTGEFVCEMCDGPWPEEGKLGEAGETADYEETIVF